MDAFVGLFAEEPNDQIGGCGGSPAVEGKKLGGSASEVNPLELDCRETSGESDHELEVEMDTFAGMDSGDAHDGDAPCGVGVWDGETHRFGLAGSEDAIVDARSGLGITRLSESGCVGTGGVEPRHGSDGHVAEAANAELAPGVVDVVTVGARYESGFGEPLTDGESGSFGDVIPPERVEQRGCGVKRIVGEETADIGGDSPTVVSHRPCTEEVGWG